VADRVAIIDADLIGRSQHRLPNLALMKLSSYEKAEGSEVMLKRDYSGLEEFDRVWIGCVFTDTRVPSEVRRLDNVVSGGTGFFYDKAPKLPDFIEHSMPDYHIYDEFVSEQIAAGAKSGATKYYTNYSIGFLTRGCFRGCAFCVNRNLKKAVAHSPLSEFVAEDRPKLCFLDDNFFACADWSRLADEINTTGKPFQFNQGLDERILTDEKIRFLFEGRTDGDLIFAFDDLTDRPIIEKRLWHIKELYPESTKPLKFYCFTGFDREDKWDSAFWSQDIFDLFERIRILMGFRVLPYVMRYNRYAESPWRGMCVTLARWCNQPAFFKKKTFREFCEANGETSAALRYAREFETAHPEISPYYDMRFGVNDL
jgi:hypothetical protein